jgi:hypothetical protein
VGFDRDSGPPTTTVSSPDAPQASRIGPTKAGLTPLDSSNTLTKVYTVNCPRYANKFDADTAVSAPRPAPVERPDAGSYFTLGSSRRTRTNVRIDSTARSVNGARQPTAVPNDVDNGTPSTMPVVAPLAAIASARPTSARPRTSHRYRVAARRAISRSSPRGMRPGRAKAARACSREALVR